MIKVKQTIPTALFITKPTWFIPEPPEEMPNLVAWHYEWEEDPFGGFLDVATNPYKTFERQEGDCVDYARVACMYLLHKTDKPVKLGIGVNLGTEPGHIAVQGERHTYSSGVAYRQTWEEFSEEREYDYTFERVLRG